eukprot:3899709-Rhodomonas_salina.2
MRSGLGSGRRAPATLSDSLGLAHSGSKGVAFHGASRSRMTCPCDPSGHVGPQQTMTAQRDRIQGQDNGSKGAGTGSGRWFVEACVDGRCSVLMAQHE